MSDRYMDAERADMLDQALCGCIAVVVLALIGLMIAGIMLCG